MVLIVRSHLAAIKLRENEYSRLSRDQRGLANGTRSYAASCDAEKANANRTQHSQRRWRWSWSAAFSILGLAALPAARCRFLHCRTKRRKLVPQLERQTRLVAVAFGNEAAKTGVDIVKLEMALRSVGGSGADFAQAQRNSPSC